MIYSSQYNAWVPTAALGTGLGALVCVLVRASQLSVRGFISFCVSGEGVTDGAYVL